MFLSDGKGYKEVFTLGTGYITQIKTNVDIDETVIVGGRLCNLYERAIYKKNFKVSAFKKS